MNRSMMLYTVCIILRVEAVFMVPALVIALVGGEWAAAEGFAAAIGALLFCSLATLVRRPRKKSISAREGFIVVALSWILVSLFGCLPFFLSGGIPSFVDSLFETVSGFTTTGATILTNVEGLADSLLYWRSFSHWLGGMGVLVLVLAIMPLARSGNNINLLRAESPGPVVDKLVPRMAVSAKILYLIYVVMTLVQFVLLLAGGLSVFESVTTALGTAGTGGFAVLNDSIASYSPYIQNVITVFMILFGVNFNIFYLLVMREYSRILRDTELWFYLGLFSGSIVLIAINVLPLFQSDFGESFRQAAFQVASVMTTTGFATVDFNLWPEFSKMLLFVLMFIGACAGSTGGGLKAARVMILGKAFVRDMRRLARPRSVAIVRIGKRKIDEDVIRQTQGYLAAYIFIIILSCLVVAIDNFSFTTTVTSVVSCMNNIGPGFDMVGPMGNYSSFSGLSKMVLSADMLIGRLEIFPMLMLFVPAAYKA